MIVVEGDSWAYTFRPERDHSPTYPGFGAMLAEEGYPVVVNAVPGSSNGASLGRLARAEWDRAIWIQTEPVRDYMIDEGALNYTLVADMVRRHGSLREAFRQHLKTQYDALAVIARGRPVYLLGGCSCLQLDLIPPSLTVVLKSIPAMFCTSRGQDSIFQNTHNWMGGGYAEYLQRLNDPQLTEDWFKETHLVNAKLQGWRECEPWFAPDYWHVNKHAHRRLVNLLKPYLDK